jgi:hypothetical protein
MPRLLVRGQQKVEDGENDANYPDIVMRTKEA